MRFLALLLFLWMPVTASAAEAVSGDEIRLEDGRVVRLLGVKAANDKVREQLQALIAHQKLLVESSGSDRYGRIAADVYVQPDKGDKIWVQGDLLKVGAVYVYPPTGSEPHLADLLKLEQSARQSKSGLWKDRAYADLPATTTDMGYGFFAFVIGKVVKAERIKNMVYLNFGEDWRKGFTVAIAAHDLHFFDDADVNPLAYQGKTVRVRGWIKRDFGPMIAVTHPSQIETLGETPAKP